MKSLIMALLLAWSITSTAQTAVPVYEEPFHRLMADSREFKILDIRIPAGETTMFHTHAEPTFYITLQRTPVRAQKLGEEWGQPGSSDWQAGDVRHDDGPRIAPFTHRVNNTGDRDFRLMLITNDRLELYVSEADLLASMPGDPGVDSKYFVQSRIDLEPGKSLKWPGLDNVLIFALVTDTHVVMRSNKDNKLAWGMHDPGNFVYLESKDGFEFENRDDETAMIIALAVR